MDETRTPGELRDAVRCKTVKWPRLPYLIFYLKFLLLEVLNLAVDVIDESD